MIVPITIGLSIVSIVLIVLLFVERKKAKNNEQIQKNYGSIIDQANDAMLVIDLVDGRIHQSNPSAASLLGYSQKELERKTLFELHPKEYLLQSSTVVADVWEKGGMIYKDIPFVTSNGELLPVECSAKVAPFSGRPAIVIYARDIRERLKMENEIDKQRRIIEEKNKDITDSIEYAKKIQEAILPERSHLSGCFNDSFILFKPKDIVSGDFYWFTKKNNKMILAVADCTGHGVPGGFMSMVGNQIITEVVVEKGILDPGKILDGMKESLSKVFKVRSGSAQRQDGMDIAIIAYEEGSGKVEFAGAFNSLIHKSESGLKEIPGDKFPIGYFEYAGDKAFATHTLEVKKGDRLYMMTDGYSDQFGGTFGKKFKSKNTIELIHRISELPMNEQCKELEKAHLDWKGQLEQVDDICVVGVRI